MKDDKNLPLEIKPLDIDQSETQEWLESLAAVYEQDGGARVEYLLKKLLEKSQSYNAKPALGFTTDYVNSIDLSNQPQFPGDLKLESRVRDYIRWNAMAMVLRSGKKTKELGGHIASFASAAVLYDIGWNYFFKVSKDGKPGDLVYVQGHCSPGVYARSFLEGRLTEQNLDSFRQEVENPDGLSSYPHSWLMPDYWQFATVSMGLGPLQAIYQARFLKYLHNRGLQDTSDRKVWCFCGDGEMDEPESLGAITLASREKLDNLIFVINCNLQRLDGPVRGNSKIIQELEGIFAGAGWRVIKVIWGSNWDPLLAKDSSGLLKQRMQEVVDGDYQTYAARGGAYMREHFFGKSPELLALVADMSDEELGQLQRGGLDPEKVYAAYAAASQSNQPVVILAQTIKGYGMGAKFGEAANTAHQQKSMAADGLKEFRDRFNLPISDAELDKIPYLKFAEDSLELKYIKALRAKLNGEFPKRTVMSDQTLEMPEPSAFEQFLQSTGDREISTTMAFARIFSHLLKEKSLSKYLVPIIADEARTFGMEGLFRQIGIYAPDGQLYQPADAGQVMYYREDQKGQLLEEGISEAGSFCSWIAAGVSYSTNNLPMIPFYIYYSMFGFQRIGDLAWAAADMQARGFLLGATAGRTTLAGEGLQHQDGHSLIQAGLIPNCVSYDPTFAYELAVIMQDGLRRMYQKGENIYYYITLMNENYTHPEMPANAEAGILKGMYLFKSFASASKAQDKSKTKLGLNLFGSGTILREVIQAAEILSQDYGINTYVWSVTSFNELAREARLVTRYNRFHPEENSKIPYVTQCLQEYPYPTLAATDYVQLYADQIRAYVPGAYTVLGTDGFGRSDTRQKLRHFFEVDCKFIVISSLATLVEQKILDKKILVEALKKYQIDPNKPEPWLK